MPQTYTEIDICNKALLRLSANMVEGVADTVASISSDSLEGKLCKLNYDVIRDIVLEDRVWSFALGRAVLDTPFANPPEFGYANKFAMPPDALNIWRIYTPNQKGDFLPYQKPWIVEDRFILTDLDKVWCHYIKRLDNELIQNASNQFIDCLSLRLAIEFCMPLTENVNLQNSLMNEYRERLIDASSIDGGQAKHEVFTTGQLIKARY